MTMIFGSHPLEPHNQDIDTHAPAAIAAAPAILDRYCRPGMIFSASTKIASAAIQKTFMTPTTKSSAMSAQQQPMQ